MQCVLLHIYFCPWSASVVNNRACFGKCVMQCPIDLQVCLVTRAARRTLAHISSCVSLGRFQHCALPRRTSRAKHFSHFHHIFVEYKSFPLQTSHGSLPGPHQALDSPAPLFSPSPWSSPNNGMFLDEQAFADCLHRVQKVQSFPASCKLSYLLSHLFNTSITQYLVFMHWCEGALFKGNISSQIVWVLRDQFARCDFPGLSCADLWQLEMWLIICVKNMCYKNYYCLWSWKNYACWRKKKQTKCQLKQK